MSEQKRNVREEPWAKNAPEYMVEAIALLVEGREEGRAMLAMLNARESKLSNREQIVSDREAAFVQAADDMKKYANHLYGPESELAKLNERLDGLETRVNELEQRKTA